MPITFTNSQVYGDVGEYIDKRGAFALQALPPAVWDEIEKLPADQQVIVSEQLLGAGKELQRPTAPDESTIEAALRLVAEIAPAVLDVAALVWPPLASVAAIIERIRK